ncbi:hypothetical protein [Paraglaciecola aestuariivivens]
MKKIQASDERSRSFFINITVVIVFVSLMLGFLVYLNNETPNIKKLALENLAERFATGVSNAHWQWQGEGRPQIVVLITYANKLGNDKTLVETNRRPIFMSHLGWPKAEPSAKGCADIWNMVLNVPMEIEGFKVFAEYFDGVKLSDNALHSICRYRLSTGPYFEYSIYSGKVTKVKQ